MILTTEQAEALPDPFIVDGEILAPKMGVPWSVRPPKVWADLDQPCSTCDGDKMVRVHQPNAGVWSRFCHDCHGTGRRVVELTYQCRHNHLEEPDAPPCDEDGLISLGLFTIAVRDRWADGTGGQYAVICTLLDS